MEYKYVFAKKNEANEFTLRELAETDNGIFSMLHEAKYATQEVEAAIGAGKDKVMELFRSNDFFPPTFFVELLADGIIKMFASDSMDSMTIECNDKDAMHIVQIAPQELVESEKEVAEIDKLLEDDDAFDADADADADVDIE